jgi:membrane protease YdiL (CAAX protease family)
MPTLPDLLYVALFAVAMPLYSQLVFWPAFHRKSQADPARSRQRLWVGTLLESWALVAVGALIWHFHDRSWVSFGFAMPAGWRLWMSIGLTLLLIAYLMLSAASVATNPNTSATVREQFGTFSNVLPHTRNEAILFGAVSWTAGFCEEFLFRGYFIWVVTPWLGWWGAAALSLLIFASGHAYQGLNGALRTGVVGALYTLAVAVLESLLPAIILHFLLDFGMGIIAWLALRAGSSAVDSADHNNSVRAGD